MASNTPRVSPPPSQQELVIEDKNAGTILSPVWVQWMDVLRKEVNPSRQNITGAGAIDPNIDYTSLSVAAGTYAVTLAVPDVPGRLKIIEMTDATGTSVTLALANVIGGTAGTTATFNAVNETLTLVSVATKWVVIDEHGVTLS